MMENLLLYAYSQEPPQVLYHYTTQAGLLGILKSREVWATHTQYLNDRSEYSHAKDLAFEQIIKRIHSPGANERDVEALTVMKSVLNGLERLCVCVFSLSEERDSLPQWRAYGGGSAGFAIGFGRNTLSEVCKRTPLPKLGKCIYDLVVQRKLIEELVDVVLGEARTLRTEHPKDWEDKVGDKMEEYMHRYAPLLKHHKFREENEWRLITGPISPIAHDFEFRAGPSMITPYFGITLGGSSTGDEFSPKEIIVGPAPAIDDAVHAVKLLLVRRGMMECARNGVTKSEVPYRSW